MIKKTLLTLVILSLLLAGCSLRSSDKITNENAGQHNIWVDKKVNIDKLKDYDIVNIEHITKSAEDLQLFEPEVPKEFNAGMFKITFQKRGTEELNYFICQTEAKVGHLAPVIPGKTVVDGYIFYAASRNQDVQAAVQEFPGMKFTKEEERYFIEYLYSRFAQEMPSSQAALLNDAKDYALAIYFNGQDGIEQFHQEQMNKLKK